MNLYCIAFGALFSVLSAGFFTGKPLKHLNLWVNTSPQEKAEINVKALYKNVSLVFFAAALLFIISGIFPEFLDRFFIWGILTWFVLTGLDVAYISKSKRFIARNK